MKQALAWALLFATGTVAADIKVMIGVDPSDRESMIISVFDLGATLARVSGQPVKASKSQDLGDIMRSTRTGEYDVYIAPAHVAASALAHGYTLVGSTDPDEIYQLVAKPGTKVPADLKGGKLYLTAQDSVAAYMARGMLNESGQSLKTLGEVMYRRTAGAGLLGIDIGLVDATVAKRNDVEKWAKEHASKVAVLLSSRPVPGGMSVVLKKDLPEPARGKLESWLLSPSGAMSGIGRVAHHSDLANYRYVAALGNWTPSQLPGVTVVAAGDIAALQQKGAIVVDVRTAKEFGDKRIRGAILIPYVEKSLKDVAFDVKLDEFAIPDQMDRNRPVIFHCNGPECWKSYKASKQALAKGFKTVYWFRGGIPEWEKGGFALETSRTAPEQAAAPAAVTPQPKVARSQ